MRADGFIGHVVFWDQPLSFRRLVYYNVTSRHAEMTGTIQPPLLAWAWRIAVGDPADEPRIATHHEWLRANRDLEGDGLLWLVQPDESGLDSSPKFDPVWGRLQARRLRLPAAGRAQPPPRLGRAPDPRPRLAGALRGDDQRPLVPRAARRGRAVDHAGARRPALGRAHRPLPRRGPARRRAARRSRPGRRSRRSRSPTCPRRSATGWFEEHLLDPKRYWLPNPPPSVSAAEPTLRAQPGPGLEAALLARADLGQRGLDALAGDAPARLRGRGGPDGRAARRRWSCARACASTTTRSPARASARATSPGPAWSSRWPTRGNQPPQPHARRRSRGRGGYL